MLFNLPVKGKKAGGFGFFLITTEKLDGLFGERADYWIGTGIAQEEPGASCKIRK